MWLAWTLWHAGHAVGLSESTWLVDDDHVTVEAVFHRDEPLPANLLVAGCPWQVDRDGPVDGDGRALRLSSSTCAPKSLGLSAAAWQQLGSDHRHLATWSGIHRGQAVWSLSSPTTDIDSRRWWLAAWMAVLLARIRHQTASWMLMPVAIALGCLLGPVSLWSSMTVVVLLSIAALWLGGLGVVGTIVAAAALGMQLSWMMAVIAAFVLLAVAALRARRTA